MTDKTHQIIGLTAATSAFLIQYPDMPVTWPVAGTVLVGSFFGSIAPDIDQPTSNFWDSVPLGSILGRLTSRALGGHRNLSHSILGLILFSAAILWLAQNIPPNWFLEPNILAQSFIVGFIAHLAADAVTVRGIPLFWPLGNDMGFPPYPLHGIRIITGKWFENLVVLPAFTVLFFALILTYAERFCSITPVICRLSPL